MKQRNLLTGILLILALLLCAGCAGGRGALFAAPTPAPTPTPVPTPTPAPTPTPVVALWGAEGAPVFAAEVERAASRVGYAFTTLPAGEEALLDFQSEAAFCIVACCVGDAPAQVRAQDVYYCMLGGADVPPGCHGVRYDGATAVQSAFAELVAYPPHCEPVRVLGLFTSEEGAAYEAYEAACGEGRFLSRGAYFQNEKKTAAKWLTDRLDDIYPGMLDAVFAETGELAAEAADALLALSRFDAEIFSASTSGEALAYMQNAPGLVVCATGYLPKAAAEIAVHNAARHIFGQTPEDETLLPETFFSGGVTGP